MKPIACILLMFLVLRTDALSASLTECDVAVHFGNLILDANQNGKDRAHYLSLIRQKGYNPVRVTDGNRDRSGGFSLDQNVILFSVHSNSGVFFDDYIRCSIGKACEIFPSGDAACHFISYHQDRDIKLLGAVLSNGRWTIERQINDLPDCNSN